MLKSWLKDESGQGMVEYGLIIGLISIVAIVVLLTLGPKIKNMFKGAEDAITGVAS